MFNKLKYKFFFFQLLIKDPTQRIGYERGVAEIKEHPWLKDVDWNLMAHKKAIFYTFFFLKKL